MTSVCITLSIVMVAHRCLAPIQEEPSATPSPTATREASVQPKPETKSVPPEKSQPDQSADAPKRKRQREPLTETTGNKIDSSGTPTANIPPTEWKRYVVAQPDVVYPAVVKRTGMQGNGVFQLAIDPKDGTVTEVKVLKHTGYKELDAIYVMNFFQWRFQPGTLTTARIPRGVHITGRANIYH